MKKVVLFASMCICLSNAFGRTLVVPDQFDRLQLAIDSSADGDTILLKCNNVADAGGAHIEGKRLQMTGVPPLGNYAGLLCALTISNSTCRLSKISVDGKDGRNGGTEQVNGRGACSPDRVSGGDGEAALSITSSDVTLSNCRMTGGSGGLGGYCRLCDPTGIECFTDLGAAGNHGYGIVAGNAKLSLVSTLIASHGGQGTYGAISVSSNTEICTTAVQVNTIIADSTSQVLSCQLGATRHPAASARVRAARVISGSPGTKAIRIEIPAAMSLPLEIALYSAEGRSVVRRCKVAAPGSQRMAVVRLGELPAGLYFLECTTCGSERSWFKFTMLQ